MEPGDEHDYKARRAAASPAMAPVMLPKQKHAETGDRGSPESSSTVKFMVMKQDRHPAGQSAHRSGADPGIGILVNRAH